ncbi:alpha-soluble NSF attachment protein [Strongylocentrotus purpuratus]|uniref:Alpha-soluble NSF attachment protein n=1 Tax=Strongylocentrotus purpuratus TaxID=7668 RepID=A0A7M7TGN9_STRPU|nr:alpha-soluble NSF attachment protein [Strongylocentrotus purpuratus]
MADNEVKGKQFMADADKKLKSSQGFFGSMFGGPQKQEEACELYQRAANMFKMAKKWQEAGDAFCRAATVSISLDSKHEAATSYVDAGSCYKKVDPKKAISSLQQAIEIYTDKGKFTMAAKHYISIAEIYENELIELDKAIENYEKAADFYKGEDSNSSANKCLLKVAMYSAQQMNYSKACQIYEEVASSAMDNSLLKYSAKDHFFKAALCHLCIDLQNAQLALQRYNDSFATFADSREYKLLQKLIGALEDQNEDAYTEAVKEYDSISRLDQWLTTILLRIKKSISSDPDLR